MAWVDSRDDFQLPLGSSWRAATKKDSENPGIVLNYLETWKHSSETLTSNGASPDKNWSEPWGLQSENGDGNNSSSHPSKYWAQSQKFKEAPHTHLLNI